MRIDPPVSLPSAATASPNATETAAPDDDPPGMRATPSALAGFTGVPKWGLMPTPEKANSVMLVRPIRAAPAWRRRATTAASAVAGAASWRTAEAARVTSPATSKRSFTETGKPASGCSGLPARLAASAARAVWMAVSNVLCRKTACAGASAAAAAAVSTMSARLMAPSRRRAFSVLRSGSIGSVEAGRVRWLQTCRLPSPACSCQSLMLIICR